MNNPTLSPLLAVVLSHLLRRVIDTASTKVPPLTYDDPFRIGMGHTYWLLTSQAVVDRLQRRIPALLLAEPAGLWLERQLFQQFKIDPHQSGFHKTPPS